MIVRSTYDFFTTVMVKNDNQLPGRSLNYHVVNSLFSIHVKLYFKDDIYLAYASIASGFKIVILSNS